MQVQRLSQDDVDVLVVTGAVLSVDAQVLVDEVTACYARTPRGVILDLCQAVALHDDAVAALHELASQAKMWPRTTFGLVPPVPPGDFGLQGLVLYADLGEALSHVDDRSPADRERILVPYSPLGPALARDAVAATAERLGLADVRDDMLLIVSEMVTNAVRHATAPVALEIEADDGGVLVAVADGSPRRPERREPDDRAEGGRGMVLVDLLSSEHGVRTEATGKTVWAALERRARPA